jgi:ribonuclease P protein component
LRPQAFPKDYRLLRRSEFRQVYEAGQRRSAPIGVIFFRPNGLSITRLGITAPTKLGGAVLRNRVKRRVREAFRLNRLAIPAGWDIVVNPREAMATVEFSKLVQELLRVFPHHAPAGPTEEARPQ